MRFKDAKEILEEKILPNLINRSDIETLSFLYHATLLTEATSENVVQRYKKKLRSALRDFFHEEATLNEFIDEIIHCRTDKYNRELFRTVYFNPFVNRHFKDFLRKYDFEIYLLLEEEIRKIKRKGLAYPDFIFRVKDVSIAIDITRTTDPIGRNFSKKFSKILRRRRDIKAFNVDVWLTIFQIGIPYEKSLDDSMIFLSELFKNSVPTLFNPKRVYGVIKEKIQDILGKVAKKSQNIQEAILDLEEYIDFLMEIHIKAEVEVLPTYILYGGSINLKILKECLERNQEKLMKTLTEIVEKFSKDSSQSNIQH